MKKNTYYNFFADFHPLVNFLFYVSVITFSFLTNNYILQTILFLSSSLYLILLNPKDGLKKLLAYLLFAMVIIIINPLVNHQGQTILTYLWDGNPLTLESIIYGISQGLMLIILLLWFSTYNYVMTSDKFIYIFGKIIPKSSLIFSMVLRFVPLYKKQIVSIEKAQRGIGNGIKNKNIFQKLKNGLKIFSIFVTWALENSIETADSMKSRGYGLKNRTAYSIYIFSTRDKVLLIIMFLCSFIFGIFMFKGMYRIVYYPTIKISVFNIYSVVGVLLFTLLCNIPVLINIFEDLNWRKEELNYGKSSFEY